MNKKEPGFKILMTHLYPLTALIPSKTSEYLLEIIVLYWDPLAVFSIEKWLLGFSKSHN